MIRVFYAFAALALLSAGISLSGKALGRAIAMAGHTDDITPFEVVIGNNVLLVPANAIRLERARRNGVATRLDLYLRWPDMEGYSLAAQDDFNNVGDERNILFLSFVPQMMSRDMSGRFDPIYRSLIEGKGEKLDEGLLEFRFSDQSGYLDEVLVVAHQPNGEPFVARCLTGASAEEALAPCERDIHMGEDLSLAYRFPRDLLPHWREMEASVLAKAGEFLKTGR